MQPEIIEKPEMILGGIVASGTSLNDLDIAGLWDRFNELYPDILNQVDQGKRYELHLEEERSPKMHFCLIGTEVSAIDAMPLEVFFKVVPAGKYALYTHHFKDGDYGQAFRAMYDWLEASEYQSAHAFNIQGYDDRFTDSEDPESVMEIFVPIIPK